MAGSSGPIPRCPTSCAWPPRTAKGVATTPPNILCSYQGASDEAKAAADKYERIAQGWLKRNRIQGYTTQMWGFDAVSGGLTVCKVMPDASRPAAERYPIFTRLEPQNSYPDRRARRSRSRGRRRRRVHEEKRGTLPPQLVPAMAKSPSVDSFRLSMLTLRLELIVTVRAALVVPVTLAIIVLTRILGCRRVVCANYVIGDGALAVDRADLFSAN